MKEDFVTYEYRTAKVKAKDQTVTTDMYEAFGWEVTNVSCGAIDTITLSMRRDRKLKHKQELNRLERRAEETLSAVNALKRAQKTGARIVALTIGIVASLILGGGMCLCMLCEGLAAMLGGIALGLAGIALCGVNYLIYAKMTAAKIKQLQPAIEENEEQFANLLEKGNDLLQAEFI